MKIKSYPLSKNLGSAGCSRKRPKTAQTTSFTQIIEFLEGKYPLINQNFRMTHNHTDNKCLKPTTLLMQMNKSTKKPVSSVKGKHQENSL